MWHLLTSWWPALQLRHFDPHTLYKYWWEWNSESDVWHSMCSNHLSHSWQYLFMEGGGGEKKCTANCPSARYVIIFPPFHYQTFRKYQRCHMFPPLQRRWPTGHIWPLSIKCLAGNKERDLVQHSLLTKHQTLDGRCYGCSRFFLWKHLILDGGGKGNDLSNCKFLHNFFPSVKACLASQIWMSN